MNAQRDMYLLSGFNFDQVNMTYKVIHTQAPITPTCVILNRLFVFIHYNLYCLQLKGELIRTFYVMDLSRIHALNRGF